MSFNSLLVVLQQLSSDLAQSEQQLQRLEELRVCAVIPQADTL